jgi:transcriptional regulator with XRE-family HTH domain
MYSRENKVSKFSVWLQREMDKREWSMSDLARNAGISRGAVANIMRGDRNPGVNVCEGIAKALKVSPEIVYRQAGILSPAVDPNERAQELVHLFNLMGLEDQEETIDYARLRLKRQEEREKKNAKREKTP